jgi:hypothetical protein
MDTQQAAPSNWSAVSSWSAKLATGQPHLSPAAGQPHSTARNWSASTGSASASSDSDRSASPATGQPHPSSASSGNWSAPSVSLIRQLVSLIRRQPHPETNNSRPAAGQPHPGTKQVKDPTVYSALISDHRGSYSIIDEGISSLWLLSSHDMVRLCVQRRAIDGRKKDFAMLTRRSLGATTFKARQQSSYFISFSSRPGRDDNEQQVCGYHAAREKSGLQRIHLIILKEENRQRQ